MALVSIGARPYGVRGDGLGTAEEHSGTRGGFQTVSRESSLKSFARMFSSSKSSGSASDNKGSDVAAAEAHALLASRVLIARPIARPFVSTIAVGGAHAAAIDDAGDVWWWGTFSGGSTACSPAVTVDTPRHVVALRGSGVVQVSCGAVDTFIASLTTVWRLGGALAQSQFSNEGSADASLTPHLAGSRSAGLHATTLPSHAASSFLAPRVIFSANPQTGLKIQQIACGSLHTLILLDTGLLYAVGDNQAGQLGIGNTHGQAQPVLVNMSAHERCVLVSAGAKHSFGVCASGRVFSWGGSRDGCLGLAITSRAVDSEKIDSESPRNVLQPSEVLFFRQNQLRIIRLACGDYHNVALCITESEFASLTIVNDVSIYDDIDDGPGVGPPVQSPTANTLGSCVPSSEQLVALLPKVYSWGRNSSGQVGLQGCPSVPSPTLVSVPSDCCVVHVSASGAYNTGFSHAVTADGQCFGFGSNRFLQVGHPDASNGPVSVRAFHPARCTVPEQSMRVLATAAGWMNSIAVVDPTSPLVPPLSTKATLDPIADSQALVLGVFSSLPNDVINLILNLLEAKEMCRLGTTSSAFASLCGVDVFWEQLCEDRFSDSELALVFPSIEDSSGPHSMTSNEPIWKRIFAMAFLLFVSRRSGIGSKQLLGSERAGDIPVPTEGVVRQESTGGMLYKVGRMLWRGSPRFKQPVRFVMLGLDAAGKTTILYKLKLGEVVTTIPTIGFNVETVDEKRVSVVTWDVGGPDKLRPLWKHYFHNLDALIFVIDSNDRERLDADDAWGAKHELHCLLAEDAMAAVPLLVFANKQDLPNACSIGVITTRLCLHSIRDRPWFVQASCATTGDGLCEGFEWLSGIHARSL